MSLHLQTFPRKGKQERPLFFRIGTGSLSLAVLFWIGVVSAAFPLLRAQTGAPASSAEEAALSRPTAVLLEERLRALAQSLDGVAGYAVKDLRSGQEWLWNADEVFATASTIKVPLLLELFRQSEQGRFRLEDEWLLEKEDLVAGSGILHALPGPLPRWRVDQLAAMMVVLSDNSATNLLLRKTGMEAVNTFLASHNFQATRLRRKMMDLVAARAGRENSSSPRELVRLLEGLYQGKFLSAAANARLLDLLRQDKDSPLRKAVPADIAVANKPGNVDGVWCDAGIVYLPDRPYILAVMTKYLPRDAVGEEFIVSAGALVHSWLARIAASNRYGRTVK